MKRRHIIHQAAVAGGLAITACGHHDHDYAPADKSAAQQEAITVRWRMATSWPKCLDVMFGTAETFCQTLSALTGGKFIITPYESGELAPGLEVLDAVMAQDVECGHTSSHYYLSKQPALAFSASLPFGLNAQQQNAWLIQGGGLKAIQELYAPLGVINFPGGNTGTQMGGWFNRQITSVEDLQGLRMRIPGLGGELMSRMGVEVQMLAADKIVDALLANRLDAVEWIGPHDDEKLGLDQAAAYYYYPGWWSPSETIDIVVNLDLWNQLPGPYQDAFQAAAALVNQAMLARYNAANGKALQRMQSRGTQTLPFSTEILQTAQSLATELYTEMANDSADFKRVYQSWQSFRQRIQRWHGVNELSFVNFAYSAVSA